MFGAAPRPERVVQRDIASGFAPSYNWQLPTRTALAEVRHLHHRSAMHKPNNQTAVLWRGVSGLLGPLSVRKIRGMGGKLGDQLEQLGITTAGEALDRPEHALAEEIGSPAAKFVHRLCRGLDDSPVAQRVETKGMLAAKSFEPQVSNRCALRDSLIRNTIRD